MEKEGRKQTPNPLWVCASGLGSQTGSIPEPSSLPVWQERFGSESWRHLDTWIWGDGGPCPIRAGGRTCTMWVLSPAGGPSIPSPGVTGPPGQPCSSQSCSWLVAHPGAGGGCEAGWGEGLTAAPHSSEPFPTWISSVPASGVGCQPLQVDPRTEVTQLGPWGSPFHWGFMGAPAMGRVRVAKPCHLLQTLSPAPDTVTCSWLFQPFSTQDNVRPALAPARAAHASSSWSGQWMQSRVGRGSDTSSSPANALPTRISSVPAAGVGRQLLLGGPQD